MCVSLRGDLIEKSEIGRQPEVDVHPDQLPKVDTANSLSV